MGCKDPGPTLDDVIAEYLQARQQRVLAMCECYPLFVDLTVPGGMPYASEDACLAANESSATDDATSCIKSVLDTTTFDDDEKISAMQCQTERVEISGECYSQNTACAEPAALQCKESDLSAPDACSETLSNDQLEAIAYCTLK